MARRLDGLDRLRGAALTLMLVHHLIGWYGSNARDVIPGWDGFALTDVAAPAFTITLGASVPLLLASRRRRGASGAELARITLRRYGLLVPIGVGLRAVVGFDLGRSGVLETLGVSALITAIVVATTPPTVRWVVATATIVAAPWVERSASDGTDWLSDHVLTGTFPLVTYVGLALLGAAAVTALDGSERRFGAGVAAAFGVAWSIGLLLAGQVPDRYPGDVSYLVPGITGTLLLYVLVTSPQFDDDRWPGRLLQRAGAHTFGVFIGHYAIYVALRETGTLHAAQAPLAVVAAVATTAALVWVAPRVPTLPWSPRTGWNRAPEPGREEETATTSPPPLVGAR